MLCGFGLAGSLENRRIESGIDRQAEFLTTVEDVTLLPREGSNLDCRDQNPMSCRLDDVGRFGTYPNRRQRVWATRPMATFVQLNARLLLRDGNGRSSSDLPGSTDCVG